jgi:hypothetical protein
MYLPVSHFVLVSFIEVTETLKEDFTHHWFTRAFSAAFSVS